MGQGSTGRPAGRPVVLVVDDEAEHRQMLSYVLRRDYDVHTAADADAALAVARTTHPALALVDQRMPGKDGTTLLAELRGLRPDCLRFLVTAYSDTAVLRRAINVGEIYRFVAKPVDPDQLKVDIHRALEHRAAQARVAELEKLAVLGQLAGTVAHDLRNYAQVVKIAPTVLRTGRASAVQLLADQLALASDGLDDLLDELLSLARGQTPRYALRPEPLAGVVAAAVRLCEGTPAFENRSLTTVYEPGVPDVPLAHGRCVRMVGNLLLNAAQASEDGGVVRVRVFRPDASHAAVEVGDDGPGVSAEARGRLFEPRFTTKGAGGVGLGLAFCRTVMEAHGGTLDLASLEGPGAVFVARFPVAPALAEGA